MTSKIHVLTEDVIGKIAAGEVVERPASVVKEMVENSIDAGATSVDVEIQEAGQSLIRVADNGCGMSEEDVKLAFLRHATSKLKNISDLESMRTFGFRGEALASISSVAQLEVTTCQDEKKGGFYAWFESGTIQKTRPASRVRGTTIEVKNLFYNVPARKKFLKKDSTELAAIIDTFGRFMVSYPGVEFKLTHGSRVIMQAGTALGLLDRVRIVLGADIAGQLIPISGGSEGYSFSGYVSKPSFTRKDNYAQIFFVNKRYVKSKALSDALSAAYDSLLERGRVPSGVIFVDADPARLDVNIHPAKLLVKFDDEKAVKKAFAGVVRSNIMSLKDDLANNVAVQYNIKGISPDTRPARPVIAEHQSEFAYDVKAPAEGAPLATAGRVEAMPGMKREDILAEWGQVFQVGACYIIKIEADKVVITDQHAAHERILYEYFSKVSRSGDADIQSLLFPVRLDLSPSESVVMEKVKGKFKTLGFDIDPFGNNSYVIQSVPAAIKDRDVKTVVRDMLNDMANEPGVKLEALEELIKIASCRAAIKAGDKLNKEEMIVLLSRLKECDMPFTCPHGRPVSFDINTDELEKRFRRK
jgi:DNA mismatch repair protein MutL